MAQPPPQPTGWIAQPRPGGYGSGIWDWTGLTLNWSAIPYFGTPETGSLTVYSYLNLTGGNAGGNTGIASFTHTLSGNSTYKWKWIPRDMNNNGQPDYQHFPADPLYILSKLSLRVQAWPHQFPPVGLEAIGGVSNGAGWSRNFTGIPGMAPLDNDFAPPRVVLTDYQNPIAVLTLSPSANVGISGTQAGAPGSTSIFIGQTNFPILLSQPDVFGRPDLGDGRNQFAFGTETPDGRLSIPTSTTTSGQAPMTQPG